MTKWSVRDIVELVGISGVIASLVFVGLEIQQNSAIARAESEQGNADRQIEIALAAATNPELSSLIQNYISGTISLDELSPDQRATLFFYFQSVVSMWQANYYSFVSDVIPEDKLIDIDAGRQNVSFIRANWAAYRSLFNDDFRNYMDSRGFPKN